MRKQAIGSPTPGRETAWLTETVQKFDRATESDVQAVVDDFEITGTLAELRTFDAATATLDELRSVVATLLNDIKERGR